MSRKSLSKKETTIWSQCNNCSCQILTKDRDQHRCNDDETTQIFIREKTLCGKQLPIKSHSPDLNGVDPIKLNNLVFLHESVFSLCDLILGDYVRISSPNLPNGAPIVRIAWPMMSPIAVNGVICFTEQGKFGGALKLHFHQTDKFRTIHKKKIFVAELKNTWKQTTPSSLVIEKLSSDIILASRLSLASLEANIINKSTWPDIKKVLSACMTRNVYCENNEITVNFFNKNFTFIIKELKSDIVKPSDKNDLADQLQAMHLTADSSPSFLVRDSTSLELIEQVATPSESTDDDTKSYSKLDCIGGVDDIIEQLNDNMNIALGKLKSGSTFFVPRSVLLIGQHGSGKTLICDAVAEQCDALVIRIPTTEIFSKYFGESESKLSGYFDKAYKNYPAPSIIIIEEIASICPKETKEESAKRVQMAFLAILDEIHVKREAGRLFLITTTSNVDNVNLAVRRFGRLDIEIEIPVPDPIAREQILLKQLQFVKHTLNDGDIKTIANNSHGFIASDLSNLVAKAALNAVKRNLADEPLVHLGDIHHGFNHVVPSAMKEVVIKCPNVKWTDIGGQEELKLQLRQAIEWPLRHPEVFTRLGISCPRGIYSLERLINFSNNIPMNRLFRKRFEIPPMKMKHFFPASFS